MPRRQIRLEGPGVSGTRVSGPMLRELLYVLIEGSRRALRVRTQGRSTARGSLPRWIAAATDFTVEIKEGSTVLEIDSPSLEEADPDEFRQADLFPEVDPKRSAVDYLIESVAAASDGEAQAKLYDKQLLHVFGGFRGVFRYGVTRVEFSPTQPDTGGLGVEPSSLRRFQEVEAKIPPPQHVNVAGKLDVIRHSDRTFDLVVGGEHVRGIAEGADLQTLWGQQVLLSGTAHFAASGAIQRVEADIIRSATEQELELFEVTPSPIGGRLLVQQLSRPQGPRSGLNAIFGKWPGDETDDQILEELDRLS